MANQGQRQHWRQMSFWDISEDWLPRTPQVTTPPKPKQAPKGQVYLEGWAHRLQACADEAHDEHLGPLESDLLDLRDEVTYVLHQQLLQHG